MTDSEKDLIRSMLSYGVFAKHVMYSYCAWTFLLAVALLLGKPFNGLVAGFHWGLSVAVVIIFLIGAAKSKRAGELVGDVAPVLMEFSDEVHYRLLLRFSLLKRLPSGIEAFVVLFWFKYYLLWFNFFLHWGLCLVNSKTVLINSYYIIHCMRTQSGTHYQYLLKRVFHDNSYVDKFLKEADVK